MSKRLGFIGAGKITSAVVEGFCRHTDNNFTITVSPRNKARSAGLARRFPQVSVAADNQAVVDQSDIVFIALIPDAAPAIIKAIDFREDHWIISLIPMIVRDEMAQLVSPAVEITRATPLPPAARHIGSVLYSPPSDKAENLLSLLGTPLAAPDEHQHHILWAVTGLISPYFALMAEISNKAVENGVDETVSRQYTAAMFQMLSQLALETGDDFNAMADHAATPGGLNEQAMKMVKEAGGYKTFTDALDAIIKRFPQR